MGRNLGPSESAMTPVTVLMAVHNGERYLGSAVGSILQQSFQQYELLIIDDASTDNTPSVLLSYEERDKRIRVLRNETNIGLTRSLNRGLAVSQGKYIARLDADDQCYPARLAVEVEYLENHPECTVLASQADLIDEDGNRLGHARRVFSSETIVAQLFIYNPIVHSTVMFRADRIKALGGYDESLTRAQDYDLWFRVIGAKQKIETLNDSLVAHRMHNYRVTINEPEAMEHCRVKTLKTAIADILGISVHNQFITYIERLRESENHDNIRPYDNALSQLRLLAIAFKKKFGGSPEAVNHYLNFINKMTQLHCHSDYRDIAVAYTTGSSIAFCLYLLFRRNAGRVFNKLCASFGILQ